MNEITNSALAKAKTTCDAALTQSKKLRHAGYYDSFGKVLYDKSRDILEPLKGEGLEEMHILNGTAASTLELWKRSDYLLGRMDALIMIMGKVVDLIVPEKNTGFYFLAVFDNDTPLSEVERVRHSIIESGKVR